MDLRAPAGSTRIVLVRHGETDLPPGRICGRLDPDLSPAGRARMAQVARWLSPAELARVYASPSRRALASAAPLASARGLQVEPVEALREVHFGALEGLSWDEASKLHPEVCALWLARPEAVRFPGGESWVEVRERVGAALAALRSRHAGETVLVVSHASVNRAVLSLALGLDGGGAFRLDQSPGAVNVVDWFGDAAVVRLVNGGPGSS